MKTCKKCSVEKDDSQFGQTHGGHSKDKIYRRGTCKQCEDKQKRESQYSLKSITCRKCGIDKPPIDFHLGSRTCRVCVGEVRMQRYIKQMEDGLIPLKQAKPIAPMESYLLPAPIIVINNPIQSLLSMRWA